MVDAVPDPSASSRWERWVEAAEGLDPVTGLLPLAVAVVGGVVVALARVARLVRRAVGNVRGG